MFMPRQAKPVLRARSPRAPRSGVTPSDFDCQLCRLACNALSGRAKELCLLACEATVC